MARTNISLNQDFILDDVPFLRVVQNKLLMWPELLFFIVAIASFALWMQPWDALRVASYIVWLLLVFVLIFLARINGRTGLLPDMVVYRFLLPLAILHVYLQSIINESVLWSSLQGLALLSVASLVVYIVSRGAYIGFGTVKLLALAGLIVGFANSVVVLAVVMLGSIGYMIITKRNRLLVGWLIVGATLATYLASMLTKMLST